MIDSARIGIVGAAPVAKRDGRSIARFRVAADGSGLAAAADAVLDPAALDGLLTLQESQMQQVADEAAQRQAGAVIDDLKQLQLALLMPSALPAGSLARLAGLLGQVPYTPDPTLRAAVSAIALRARIELAKREACH